MKIDIVKIAKEALKDKELIIENVERDKVRIWYKERGQGPNPFILPQEIDLDEGFVEAIGIYCGDGKLTLNDLTHIDITSKDEDIAKFMFEFFTKRLNVNLDYVYLEIVYRNQSKRELKQKWSKILNVSEEKLHVTRSTRHRKDVLHIQISGIILRKIFQKIIEVSLPIIKKNPALRKAFLRGHFAADGGIAVTKDVFKNYIVEITFNYNPSSEKWLRDYIIELLKTEGIKDVKWKEYKHKAYIRLNNWKNYIKLWRIDLFNRCIRKKNMFLKAVKDMDVYLEFKEDFRKIFFESLTLPQWKIAKIINSWQPNVSRTIKGDHLLRLEQIEALLGLTHLSWSDVFNNTKRIRIGMQTFLSLDKDFMKFLLVEKIYGKNS